MLVIAAAFTERDCSREQLEAALLDEQEVARKLRLVDGMKDSTLAVVSHELRTPLTSILKECRSMLNKEKLGEMSAHLTCEARCLDSLLADLLDASFRVYLPATRNT